MPVLPENIWNVLHTVSRYLFPLLALSLVILVLFFILSESANRRERIRNLPGSPGGCTRFDPFLRSGDPLSRCAQQAS